MGDSAAYSRQGVGDAQGERIEVHGGNAVGDELYRETAGNRGTVGGVTTDI